ncbi:MAG: undecaprenyldiphospho-muramoylpentapeptide beta-N-acetylglucosaminyltransferase [Cyanobacteriota/Melainabacteria group bacterium]
MSVNQNSKNRNLHRVVLTGGGTGGHVYPALSVYEQLVKEPSVAEILYIGALGHLEEKLCAERDIAFAGLRVSGMPRRPGLSLLRWPFEMTLAIVEARRLLGRFDPTVVLGTGGYASAAPLAAGLHLGVPIAVHEPDAHPGLVNKLFAQSASLVSLGMEGASDRIGSGILMPVVNGNPIRESFSGMSREEALRTLSLDVGRRTVAFTGGSQGAKAINDSVRDMLVALLDRYPDLQVIHQAGGQNLAELQASLPDTLKSERYQGRYLLRDYFPDMALVYSASDLVVARAGAMTIAELTACGLPSVFIPYPYAAQDHQMHNARYLESKGGARVIAQDGLSSAMLLDELSTLLDDNEKMAAMAAAMKEMGRPQAAKDLAEQLLRLSSKYLGLD